MKAADISGKWKVNITSTGGSQLPPGSEWTAFITANQYGTAISGTFVTEHGLSGNLTGSVSGYDISMTVEQGPIRPGTFSGVAKVNAKVNSMSGTYSGGDGAGTLEADFTAYKMSYCEVVLAKIRSIVFRHDDDMYLRCVPLWILGLIGLFGILLIIGFYFTINYLDRLMPNFSAFRLLAFVLIIGIYGLFKLIKRGK